MNDWKTLVFDATFITAVLSIITAIRYRKQNKKLKDLDVKNKESEAKVSDVDAQKAQIDLGEMFTLKAAEMFGKMQELQEKTLKATEKNGIDNEGILKQLNDVVIEQKRIAEEQKRFAEEQTRQGEEIKRSAEEQKRLSDSNADIVSFLNGEFQDFLKKRYNKTLQAKKTTSKKRTTAKKEA